jgi:hypothetical protein
MFNFDPNDPRQMGLLMAAARMLEPGPGGVAGSLSRAVPTGLMGYQTTRGLNDRRAEEEQQRRMREFTIKQAEEQRAQQGQMRSLAQSAFGPNPNLVAGDDQGNPMPQAPGGGGMPEFAKGMMGIDPMTAISLMPKPRAPMVLAEGARAFDDSGREIAANPRAEKKEPMWGKINPAEYTVDSVRKFAASQNHADLVPYRKPDRDDSPRPQLYDGPEGPVWVTAPTRGQNPGTLPVTDPQGNPISAKKRNQPLTESQAKATLFLGQMRGAEKSIEGLAGIDPTNKKDQAQIGAAMAAKETGPLRAFAINALTPASAQRYAQAAEQWSEAFLRIKTGAAATRDEVVRNVRTFFPQPGEDAETVRQKNEARADATKQMEILAGGGTQQLDGQSEPKAPKGLQKNQTAIYKAKEAIKAGKDPAAVRQRLIEQGFDPAGL